MIYKLRTAAILVKRAWERRKSLRFSDLKAETTEENAFKNKLIKHLK
jgi:hypothetical protein